MRLRLVLDEITAHPRRDYGLCPTRLRLVVILLLMLFVGVSGVKAQDVTEGLYYFGSHGYDEHNTTENFYLCPTEPNETWPWYYTSSSPYYTSTNTGMPFMTTYQCRDGVYDSQKALWVVKDAGNGYVHIIHFVDGKYLTYNTAMENGSNAGRMRIHLQEMADGDNALFKITYVQDKKAYDITSKNGGTRKYLNVTGTAGDGNRNSLIGESTKQDGPNKINVGALIGLWTSGSSGDNASQWYPESTILATPIISEVSETNTITITDANGLPEGYEIRYNTGDGTQDAPTATTGEVYSDPIVVEDNWTIKAVVVRYGMVLTGVASKAVEPHVVAPTVTNNFDGTISLSTTTPNGEIYYTLDGNTPTNGSSRYTSAFSLEDATVIKAITYFGNFPSDVTTYNVPKYTTPTISFDNTTSKVTITCTDATGIYYNTGDGSQADPTISSTPYSNPLDVTSPTTVKAIATHAGYLSSEVATLVISQVSTPVIAIVDNAITISCATDGATIYYIVDSGEPTNYSAPLGLSDDVSGHAITAYAIKSDMFISANAEATANETKLLLPTPTITLGENDVVTFSINPTITGVTYKYTLDGTDPNDSNGTECSGSFTLNVQAFVKVISTHSNYISSGVVTLFNKPDVTLSQDIYTYNNTAYEPTVSKVSITISETEYEAPTSPTPTYAIGGYVNNINAGTATVNLIDDDDSDNIFFSNFSTTFTINPAALTITPDNGQSKQYGDPDPELTYTNVGLVEGDVLAGALARAEGENAGTYAINQGTLDNSHNPNYAITFTTGKTFAITPKSLGSGTDPAENITIEITEADAAHVIVKQGGKALRVGTAGTDYDYSISTIGDADTKYFEVAVTGKNNYTGSFTAKFANVTFGTNDNNHYWGTFVSDNNDGDFAVLRDMEAYIVTGIDAAAGTIVVEGPLDNIPEGEPVLLLSTVNANGFIVKTKNDGTSPKGSNLLMVESSAKSVITAEIYLLYKGEFVLNAEGILPAGKIYLPKPSGSPAPARLHIVRSQSTGIDNPQLSTLSTQLSGIWYTLDGRRLSGKPTKKGLYLQNGKKMVVR